MPPPRQLLPNSTYMITRRCHEGRFFLRPDSMIAQIFLYCLGYALRYLAIEIHAFIVLSNHWHLIVTDLASDLPRLMENLHKLVSKCVNTFRGRWGTLWDCDPADPEVTVIVIVRDGRGGIDWQVRRFELTD